MPTRGPFPIREAELNTYFSTVSDYLTTPANATRLGVNQERKNSLQDAVDSWNGAYAAAANPATRTAVAVSRKDDALEALTDLLRTIYDDIPASALTAADRATLGLAERAAPTQAPIPSTAPIATVDTSARLQHTLSFADESTPGSRAKPGRVRGCQIWVAVGGATAPADPKDYRYLATDTATPYVAHYDGADGGKTAHYILRWENTRGECGPWSPSVAATIPA